MALDQDVRRVMREMLADPLSLPFEFRSWVTQWIEVSGSQLPSSQLTGLQWASFTPALTASVTSPTLGTGSTASGRFARVGTFVVAQATLIFGTSGTGAGSGSYYVSLPIAPVGSLDVVGDFMVFDNSPGAYRAGVLQQVSSGQTAILVLGGGNEVTDAAPWAWAASDQIRYRLGYEAA